MKPHFTIFFISIISLMLALEASAQKPSCEGNSYSAEIISKKEISETCIEYEIKVSYDGTRSFGLSHFSIGIPCGEVKNVSNSENWKQVFGKDPTTGVYGLKIDDIQGFGSNGADSFTIKFTWCSDASCEKKLDGVSYKAGQCVDYQHLIDSYGQGDNDQNSDTDDGGTGGNGNGGNTGGGDGTGEDGDGSGDGSGTDGDGTGNDGSTPTDSTSTTCSTLIAKLQKTNVSCAGEKNGQLQVIIEDGTEPFTYAWSTGEATATIHNLLPGIYSVTITDAKGNIITLTEEINAPDPITINESIINPSCNGLSNGVIQLSVTGGTGAYAFSWSNGEVQQNISGLSSGSYTVSVIDGAGCIKQKTITLTNSTAITVGVAFTHPLCGQTNGTIDITPTGGVAPYTYFWSTGATTQDLQNSGPGTYTVKITDANGCSVDMVYALRNNNTMVLKYTVNPTSCLEDASGAINLTVTGGTPPYTYAWQDGVTTEDRTGLKAGLYKVTVTDAGGCSSVVNVNVFKKTFTVNSEVIQPSCVNDTGTVTLTPVDGTSPYTYSWSNGDTDNSITGGSGTYSVTVTDASGCSINMVFTITTPPAINATGSVFNLQCGSEGAYSIDLTVTGGKSPYSYTWSNGAITQDLTGINSGNYSVTITDANGCIAISEFNIAASPTTWACMINPPSTEVVCKSAGNSLSTSMTDASTYQWTVTSTDNSWVITAGSSSSTVVYSAGNAGTSATFSLTITKEGCTKICHYTTAADGCLEKDNTGGGDPSVGDPCSSDSTATNPTIAGKEPLASSGEEQQESSDDTSSTSGEPEEASTEDTVTEPSGEDQPTGTQICSAYPNPFTERVSFEWISPDDDYVQVEVLDMLGRRAAVLFSGNVRKGQSYKCDWSPSGSDKMYIYTFNSSRHKHQGKLFVR